MSEISIKELRNLCIKALSKTGMREEDVKVTTDHFLENECSGKRSHGIIRIVEAVKMIAKYGVSTNDPTIEKDTGSMLTMNANGQVGVVAGHYAMQKAIERGKEHGIALIGIHNFISNSGAMAYYLRRLTAEGLIGIMSANSVALVAPPGGKKRMIGTNPFSCGIPGADGEELILDMGTGAIAYGKTMVLKDQGQPIPDGMIIDKDGYNANDPGKIYEGAILPLADHKGFGLGLMIELMAGPLIGGMAIKDKLYAEDGLFIIVIDPTKIAADNFYTAISDALDEIRNSPLRPNATEITIPGDRSKETLAKTLNSEKIDIVSKTLEQLKTAAKK